MSTFQGFFDLKTPADLLEKLKRDLVRMREQPTGSDPAFDFFVTAETLLNWRYPDSQGSQNRQVRSNLHNTEPTLEMTWDLARGAKHFEATQPPPQSVDSVRTREGYFSSEYFASEYFDTGSLDIDTGPHAAALGPKITALDLAERVVRYWENDLASP